MKKIAVLLLAASGCGSQCIKDDVSGTYLARWQKMDGNSCSDVPDSLLMLNSFDDMGAIDGCETLEMEITKDECTNELHVICPGENGGTVEVVGVINQEESGRRLTGIVTIIVSDITDHIVCSGSYEAIYERH